MLALRKATTARLLILAVLAALAATTAGSAQAAAPGKAQVRKAQIDMIRKMVPRDVRAKGYRMAHGTRATARREAHVTSATNWLDWLRSSADVQLLALNDLHGNLEPPTGSSATLPGPDGAPMTLGGTAYLATHLKALRTKSSITYTAGDLIGGTPFLSAAFKDEPTIESLRAMGVDGSAVGNHEFDEGWDELQRIMRGGCHRTEGCFDEDGYGGNGFPYLGANVIDKNTGLPKLPPFDVRMVDGVPVAFIGAVTKDLPNLVAAYGIKDIKVIDEATAINNWANLLSAFGINSVVAVIHEGGVTAGKPNECGPGTQESGLTGPAASINARLNSRVDVVVGGHTHYGYVCKLKDTAGKTRYVVSGSSFGRLITEIRLPVKRWGWDVDRNAVTAENHYVTRDVTPDADQLGIIAKWKAKADTVANRVVGEISADIGRAAGGRRDAESSLSNLIADAQLEATRTADRGNAQIALMNPGGVRADLTYAGSPAGEGDGKVTYGEAFTVQPFNNWLVTMTLTGDQIKRVLEEQWRPDGAKLHLGVSDGFTYSASASAPVGSKVDAASIKLNGTTISPAGTYRVTVNSFLADGGDAFATLRAGIDRLTGGLDVDAFIAYLGAHQPTQPAPVNRTTTTP